MYIRVMWDANLEVNFLCKEGILDKYFTEGNCKDKDSEWKSMLIGTDLVVDKKDFVSLQSLSKGE